MMSYMYDQKKRSPYQSKKTEEKKERRSGTAADNGDHIPHQLTGPLLSIPSRISPSEYLRTSTEICLSLKR